MKEKRLAAVKVISICLSVIAMILAGAAFYK
ncbi:MAG: hypothetical protein XD57_1405, partial [Thermotoga petrophila]